MKHSHVILALFIHSTALAAAAEDAAALWAEKVQPLFDVRCVKCHGPLERKSGLELDTREGALKGGESGPAVVPGQPEQSRLYQFLAPDSDPHMPPKKQLDDAERAVIRQWITALGESPVQPDPTAQGERPFASPQDAIDAFMAAGWRQTGLTPAAPADDRTWCRRVYLDLAGRIPAPDELSEFLHSTQPDKRALLVEKLLASDTYVVRMRELWDVFLMGRPVRENREKRRREHGWWAFLEDAFRSNRPWNEVVRDLIVARQEKPDRKGAPVFLYERRNEHQAIAEAVAPLVYGTRIDCAQCHDHPLAREIRQAHYWGLVAVFNRSKNVDNAAPAVGESATGGFINFTNLKKESQPAVMALLDGRTLEESRPAPGAKDEDAADKYLDPAARPRVPKFSRRAAFAAAVTENNPLLARAFVNRMWSVLMGRGIVHPADEMNARNAPSHPELLDWLANDFAAHQFDIMRLIRGIVLSRVYGLGAAPGAPPAAFTGALERPLTAEQLARSWRIAAGLPPDDDALRRAVVAAMPDVMPKDYNATFQQAQFLTNSSVLADLLKSAPAVERLAALPDSATRVREAFLLTYGRLPDAEEAIRAVAFLDQRPDQPADACRDLLWALLTSAEFLTMPR